ncbi:MAG: transcriptional regulator, TetR family [Pseudonocardiales bacterium]|nr:transcriptional regulator, TetR family [Pseudonocardiales bacterium]
MARVEASAPGLRADAARNRCAIIEAAGELYGQHGLDTPFDDIARHAGVGNATLYRHFPTRCALLAAVFADTLERVVEAAERALAIRDPWDGFAAHLTFLCNLQATNRGLADLLITAVTGAPEIEQLRKRAYRAFVRLSERAKASGSLRADFTPEDLVLLLMANAGLVHRTGDIAPVASERFITLALDGLRKAAATTGTSPPGAAVMRRAMRKRGQDLGYT